MNNEKITLSSIGGYEYQKREAIKIIDFFRNYDSYIAQGAKLCNGLFFYGSPGNGKTMFANAIANESGVKVVNYSDTPENFKASERIKAAYAEAEKCAPCILIIDEIDQIVDCSRVYGKGPSDSQREALSCLLTNIDSHRNSGILLIATANTDIVLVPDALVRNGRIEKHILVGMPDYSDRKDILRLYLRKNKIFDKIKEDQLAKITNGVSCSGLETLVNDVLIKAISSKKNITINDFTEPLQVIISNGIKAKDSPNKDHVIYHEIGHFVADYILNGTVGLITTDSFGRNEGSYYRMSFTGQDSSSDEGNLQTFRQIRNSCICGISGLVATEIFMGERFVGASNDIAKICSLYKYSVVNGLIDDYGVLSTALVNEKDYTASFPDYKCALTDGLSNFIKDIVSESKRILNNNKTFINKFFNELKEKRTLSAEEARAFVDAHKDIIIL